MASPSGGQRFVVIGGCGFLGRVIVEQLLQQQPPGSASSVAVFDIAKRTDIGAGDPRVTFIIGDITRYDDVLAATRDADVVIHTASPPHGRGPAVYFAVNVDGTNNVIRACVENRVGKLVYTSSASVIYNGQSLVDADETYPYCKVHMDAYNETKALAEEAVLNANGKGGLLTIALRPAGIFGPRDMQGASTLLQTAKSGKTKVQIGDNETLFDWTYVDNIAHAHLLASDRLARDNGTAGEAFNITNDEPMFFWDFVKMIWAAYGHRRTLQYAIPLPVAFAMAYLVEFFVMLLKPIKELHPTFTVFRIMIFSSNRHFNISKAKSRLGYKPIVTLNEGVKRTVEYFKDKI